MFLQKRYKSLKQSSGDDRNDAVLNNDGLRILARLIARDILSKHSTQPRSLYQEEEKELKDSDDENLS